MVAVVAGSGLGLNTSSALVLGGAGLSGAASFGRQSDRVYVNASNGNLVIQQRDEFLAGRGPDALGLRTYNSLGVFTDDNGDNWQPGLARQVWLAEGSVNSPGSVVRRRDEDGSEAVFLWDSNLGRYIGKEGSGAHDTLSYDSGSGNWIFVDGSSRLAEVYSGGNRRLLQITDADGQSLSFAYNGAGLLSSVTTSAGEVSLYDYNGSNQLTQIRTASKSSEGAGLDRTLTRVRYGFDHHNRLSSVSVDLSPEDNSVADGRVFITTYTYHGASRLVASIAQSDGARISFEYDASQRVERVIDALGGVTHFAYDTANRSTTVTNALQQASTHRFDAQGRLTQLSGPAVNGVVSTVHYAYNAHGDVASITDAEGRAVVMDYDDWGNVVRQIDAAGNRVRRFFNAQQQVLAETTPTLGEPGLGNPAARYTYDDTGTRLRFAISAEGRVTEHRYDALGQRTASIQYAGANYPVNGLDWVSVPSEATMINWANAQDKSRTQRIDFAYDWRGQLRSQTSYARVDGAGNGVYDGSQATTQYIYDAAGQLIQTVDPKNGVSQIGYDGLGRVLTTTNALNQISVNTYDDVGGALKTTAFNGLVSTSTFDRLGRLVATVDNAPSTPTQRFTASAHMGIEGSSVRKVGGDPSWNSGVHSHQGIAGGAIVSFKPAQTNKYLMVGLNSDPAADSSYWSLDWALYPAADGHLYIYENGQWIANTGAYAAGDQLSVSYDGSTVRYVRNGQVLRSVTTTITQPLYADSSFHDIDGRITDLRFEAYTHPDGNFIVDGGLSGDGRTFTKTGGDGNSWSSAFRSRVGYTGGAGVSFRPAQTDKYLMVGLNSDAAADSSYWSLDWAFYAAGDGHLYIYENGQWIANTGAYAAGDQLSVSYDGTAIRYVKNGVVLRSVTTTITQPLYADSSFVNFNSQVTDLVFEGSPALSGVKSHYDANGQLRMTQDSRGTRQWFFYDEAGRKQAEVNALGLATEHVYNRAGQLTHTVARANQVNTSALVDAAGKPTALSFSAISPAGSAADRKSWSAYDAAGRLAKTVGSLGEVTEFTYDAAGRLLLTRRYANAIDTAGLSTAPAPSHIAARASSQDTLLRSFYDNDGLRIGSLDATGSLQESQYDAAARLVATLQRTAFASAAQVALATGNTSAASTALAQVRPADGGNDQKALNFYNARGQLVAQLDGEGYFSETVYNAAGNVTNTLRYSLKTTGLNATSPLDQVRASAGSVQTQIAYEYDALNRVLKTRVDPQGLDLTTTSFFDDANGQLYVTNPNTTVTRSQLDAKGRVLSTTVDPSGLNLTTRTSYDAQGLVSTRTDANGVVTAYTYDELGRTKTATQDPGGLGLLTTYAYDRQGNLARTIDAKGQHTRYIYDANNRLQYTLDAEYGLTENVYNALGQIAQTIRYADKQMGVQTTDQGAGLISNTLTSKSENPARDQVTRYVYDAAGRARFAIDANGTVTESRYDAAGQLISTHAYERTLRIPGQPTEAQMATALSNHTTRFDSGLDGFWGGAGVWEDGRLKLISQPEENGGWTGMYSPRHLNSGASLKLDVTPAQLQATTHFMLDSVAGTYNRLCLILRGDGIASVQIANAKGQWREIRLGSYAAGTTYTVEILSTATGGTVYMYAKGASRSSALTATVEDEFDWTLIRTSFYTSRHPWVSGTTTAFVDNIEERGPEAKTTRYVYDAAGRRTFTVDAAGSVEQFEYDAAGQLVSKRELANAVPSGGAIKLLNTDNQWHAIYNGKAGVFKAGDVVTATVRFKAPPHLRGEMFLGDAWGQLGGSDYQNCTYAQIAGNGDWQTLTATLTMKNDDNVQVFLYNMVASTEGVTYDNLRISSGMRGEVLVDDFQNADVADLQTRGWHIGVATQPVVEGQGQVGTQAQFANFLQTLADPARDRVTRYAYDAAGRQTYSVDAAGSVTQFEYDAVGQVVSKREFANAVPSGGAIKLLNTDNQWHAIYNGKAGVFKAGDVVTATVRFKAPPHLRGEMFLGDAWGQLGGSDYQNCTYAQISGNGDWQTLTATLTMKNDDNVQVYLYNMVASADGVVYDNLRISSFMRGEVLVDDFQNADVASLETRGWGVAVDTQAVASRQAQDHIGALHGDFLAALADPVRDRVTHFKYDAAGRKVGEIDGSGSITEFVHDRVGQVVQTIQYATSSKNLLSNGGLAAGTQGFGSWASDMSQIGFGDRLNSDWSVPGQGTLWLRQNNNAERNSPNVAVIYSTPTGLTEPLTPGRRYFVSAQVGVHRADARIMVKFLDASGQFVAWADPTGAQAAMGYQEKTGGRALSNYKLLSGYVVAPSGATQMQLEVHKGATGVGEHDSYLFVASMAVRAIDPADASQWRPQSATSDRTTRFIYDAAGRVAYTQDALGAVVRNRYDAMGRLIERIGYAQRLLLSLKATVAEFDNAVSSQGQGYQASRTVYDAVGRARFSIQLADRANDRGVVTEILYDTLGRVARQIQHAVFVRYSAVADTMTDSEVRALLPASTQDARETLYTYDAAGRQVFRAHSVMGDGANKHFAVTEQRYDGLGQLSERVAYQRRVVLSDLPTIVGTEALRQRLTPDASRDRIDRLRYDANGRVVQSTDAEGFVERFTFDALGNKTSYTNKNGAVTTYSHDAAGRLIEEQSSAVAAYTLGAEGMNLQLLGNAPEQRILTRLTYDALGNLTSRTEAAGTEQARTTRYEYDALGRQVRTRFAPVGVFLSTVDSLRMANGSGNGRNITRADLNTELVSEVAYDAFGQAVASRDVAGKFSYKTYDQLGRVLLEVDANRHITLRHYSDLVGQSTTLERIGAEAFIGEGFQVRDTELTNSVGYARWRGGSRKLTTHLDALGRTAATEDLNGAVWSLDAKSGESGLWTRRTEYAYNVFGDLQTKSTQLNGNNANDSTRLARESFFYDLNGGLLRSVDAEGGVTSFVRDAFGQEVQRIEHAARLDPVHNAGGATTRISAAATLHSDIGHDREVQTEYNRRGEVVRTGSVNQLGGVANTSGGIDLQARAQSLFTHFQYDGAGNLLKTWTEASDSAGSSTIQGSATLNHYDALGRLVASAVTSNKDNNRGALTVTRYDALGNALQSIRRAVQGGLNGLGPGSSVAEYASGNDQIVTTRYDTLGRVIQVRDARGNDSFSSLDASGNVVKQWQPYRDNDGNARHAVSYYQYDAVGRQTETRVLIQRTAQDALLYSTESAVYNAYGEITQKRLDGVITQENAYDAGGRVWKTTAGGTTKIFAYDLNDQISAQFASSASDSGVTLIGLTSGAWDQYYLYNFPGYFGTGAIHRTITQTDRLGRTIGQSTSAVTRSDGSSTTTDASQELDRWGNVLTISRNGSQRLTYRYDGGNRVVSETQLGIEVYHLSDSPVASSSTKRIFYDAWGRNIGNIDGLGNANAAEYNSLGQLRREYRADGGTVAYTYDLLGRQETKDEEQIRRTTRYTYNANNQLTQTSLSGGLRGSVTEYDALGRKVKEFSGHDSSTWDVERRYDYDGRGLMWRSQIQGNTVAEYRYDAQGQKISETDANGRISTWAYDTATGLLKSRTDLGGAVYSYVYNAAGLLSRQSSQIWLPGQGNAIDRQRLNYSYYEDGRLKSLADGFRKSATTYDYDRDGNRTREVFTEQGEEYRNQTSVYDGQGRLTRVFDTASGVNPLRNGSKVFEVAIGYDAAGNRRRVATSLQIATTSVPTQATQWFTYDAMNRWRGEGKWVRNGAIAEDKFTQYDQAGRATKSVQVSTGRNAHTATSEYTYDVFDRIVKERSSVASDWTNYYAPQAYGPRDDRQIEYGNGFREETSWVYGGDQTTNVGLRFNRTEYLANGLTARVLSEQEGLASNYQYDKWVYRDPNTRGTRNYYEDADAFDQDEGWGWRYKTHYRSTSYVKRHTSGEQLFTYDKVGNLAKLVVNGYAAKSNYAYAEIDQTRDMRWAAQSVYTTSYYLMDGYRERGQSHSGWQQDENGVVTNYNTTTSRLSYDANSQLAQTQRQLSDGSTTTNWLITDNAGKIVQNRTGTYEVTWGSSATHFHPSYYRPEYTWHTHQDFMLTQWHPATFYTAAPPGTVYNIPVSGIGELPQRPSFKSSNWTTQTNLIAGDQPLGIFGENSSNYGRYSYGQIDIGARQSFAAQDQSVQYHTAQAGDTVASLAQRYYGDSALWYLIAEANGLSTQADAATSPGLMLKIPKVTRTTNTASSFAVYEPSKIIGNTSPEAVLPPPPPAPKDRCGAMSSIIAVVVTVAVSLVYGPAAGAAAGDAARQYSAAAFNNRLDWHDFFERSITLPFKFAATNLLDPSGISGLKLLRETIRQPPGFTGENKYDYKSTAIAAAAAWMGGKVAPGSPVTAAVTSNVTAQTLNMAFGRQEKFDWRGVVASAASAWLTQGMNRGSSVGGLEGFANNFANGMVRGTVGQMIRMTIYRQGKLDFAAVAADAFGNALGSSIVDKMSQSDDPLGDFIAKNNNWAHVSVGPTAAQQQALALGRGPLNAAAAQRTIGGLPSGGYQWTFGDETGFRSEQSRQQFSRSIATPAGGSAGGPFIDFGAFDRTVIAGSYGGDYSTFRQGIYADGNQWIEQTYHRGFMTRMDEGLERASRAIDNALVRDVQDAGAQAYASGNWFGASWAAASYLPNKVIGGALQGVVSLPRLYTSNDMLPGLIDAAANPMRTARAAHAAFGNMSSQDKIVAAVELLGPAALKLASGSRWTQRLGEYQLEFPSLSAGGFDRYQAGAVPMPTLRDLRAEVAAVLPEGFELNRITRGGSAILRYGDDTFYSVPKSQYSLIPELRTMDTMGDVFTQRVQSIADRFNPSLLSDNQIARLSLAGDGWLGDRFMSAYKGSYVHDGFRQQLGLIDGGGAYSYKTVGPDVVQVGGSGNGLKYEITQLTPSLNAIYSHTRKYSDELLRYVMYR